MTDEADFSETGDLPEPGEGPAAAGAVAEGGADTEPVPEPAEPPEVAAPPAAAPAAEDTLVPDDVVPDDVVAGAEVPTEAVVGPAEAGSVPALAGIDAAIARLGERMAAVEAAVFAIGSVGQVLDAVGAVEQRVGEIARLGDRHNELIDKLHAENQSLRKGELTQAVAPIFRDLIRLSDQLAQLDETSPEPGKGDAALAGRQVLEILARSGVRPEEAPAGVPFDSTVHQGIGRRPTDDPASDGMVASVRRPGFVGPDGKLLRAAEVEVWRYEAPAPAESVPAPVTAPVPVAVPPTPESAAVDTAPDPEPTTEPATEPAAPAGDTEGDD